MYQSEMVFTEDEEVRGNKIIKSFIRYKLLLMRFNLSSGYVAI